MNSDEFGQQVKQKYPQYANIPNQALTQAVIKKYPQYASAVQDQQPAMPGQGQGQPPMAAPPSQPPMQEPPQAPMQQQPFGGMDRNELLKAYSRVDPQGVQAIIGKLIEQQVVPPPQKQGSFWRIVPGMISPSGKPIQQNEQSGEVREADLGVVPTGRGNAAFHNGVKVTSPTDDSKAHFYESRGRQADIGGMSMIEKQIDPSVAGRTTPLGAAASSIRRAINGLSLLQQPVVTKTALEATLGDIDSILTQAGATVEGRKMLAGSNVYQNVANYKAYVSAAPDQVPVPEKVVNIYRNILTDLGPIQEKFVKDRIKQQGEFYRAKGEQLVGKQKYDDFLNRTINGFSIDLPGAKGGGLTPEEQSEFAALEKKYGGKK